MFWTFLKIKPKTKPKTCFSHLSLLHAISSTNLCKGEGAFLSHICLPSSTETHTGRMQVKKKMLNWMAWCPPRLPWVCSFRVSSLVDLCWSMHCSRPESLAILQGSTHCLMKPEKCLQRMSTSPSSVRTVVKSLQLPVGNLAPWTQPQQKDAHGYLNRNSFSESLHLYAI